MSFKINEFISTINFGGISRAHSFHAIIIPPSINNILEEVGGSLSNVDFGNGASGAFDQITSGIGDAVNNAIENHPVFIMSTIMGALTQQFTIRCEATELPGKGFATHEYTTYGPVRKIPYAVTFDDINLTFISDQYLVIRKIFDAWQNLIQHPRNFYFEYYKNYVGSIILVKYSEKGIPIHGIRLEEIYPLSVLAQPLDYNETNQYQKVTVQFAYRKWTDPTAYLYPDHGLEIPGQGGNQNLPALPSSGFPTTDF